ncbi:MAG: hypothetical protein EHM55_12705 [Acidobacteria bacterium]|nr:MAG: hypothetical protein EHM55_12705 [Acidobacteriota bacterium]
MAAIQRGHASDSVGISLAVAKYSAGDEKFHADQEVLMRTPGRMIGRLLASERWRSQERLPEIRQFECGEGKTNLGDKQWRL